MTKQPPDAHNTGNLAEAIVASGLVKNVKLVQSYQSSSSNYNNINDAAIAEQNGLINHYSSNNPAKKRSLSSLDNTMAPCLRNQNQVKLSPIEHIYVDRQFNHPLPKLKPQGPPPRTDVPTNDISFVYDRPQKKEISKEVTNEQLLNTFGPNESITFPRVLYATSTLAKPQVASRANYENLKALLDHLMSKIDSEGSDIDRISAQRDAFNTIMSELVRQGAYECAEKGDILNSMRTFMNETTEQIPALSNELKKIKENSVYQIAALQSENQELEKKNELLNSRNTSLENEIKDVESQLQFLQEKIPALEEETKLYRLKTEVFEKRLSETTDELDLLKKEKQKLKIEMNEKSVLAEELSNELRKRNESKFLTKETIKKLTEENTHLKVQNRDLKNQFNELNLLMEETNKKLDEATETINRRGAMKNQGTQIQFFGQRNKNEYQQSGDAVYKNPKRYRRTDYSDYETESSDSYEEEVIEVRKTIQTEKSDHHYYSDDISDENEDISESNNEMIKKSDQHRQTPNKSRNSSRSNSKSKSSLSNINSNENSDNEPENSEVQLVPKANINHSESSSQKVAITQSNTQKVNQNQSNPQKVNQNQSNTQKMNQNQSNTQKVNQNQSNTQKVNQNQSNTQKMNQNQSNTPKVNQNQSNTQKVTQNQSNPQQVNRSQSNSQFATKSQSKVNQKGVQSQSNIQKPSKSVEEQPNNQTVAQNNNESQSLQTVQTPTSSNQKVDKVNKKPTTSETQNKTKARQLASSSSQNQFQTGQKEMVSKSQSGQVNQNQTVQPNSINKSKSQSVFNSTDEQIESNEQVIAQTKKTTERVPSDPNIQNEEQNTEEIDVNEHNEEKQEMKTSPEPENADKNESNENNQPINDNNEPEVINNNQEDEIQPTIENEPNETIENEEENQNEINQNSSEMNNEEVIQPSETETKQQSQEMNTNAESNNEDHDINQNQNEINEFDAITEKNEINDQQDDVDNQSNEINEEPISETNESKENEIVEDNENANETIEENENEIIEENENEIIEENENEINQSNEVVDDNEINENDMNDDMKENNDDIEVIDDQNENHIRRHSQKRQNQDPVLYTATKTRRKKNKKHKEKKKQEIKSIEEIKKLKNDYEFCKEMLGDISLAQFDKLREKILISNDRFLPTVENFIIAQDGTFDITQKVTQSSKESMKLFVHALMNRVMSRAVYTNSFAQRGIQSTEIEENANKIAKIIKIDAETLTLPYELHRDDFKDNFTRLLDPTYSDRPPRTFEWIMKSLKSIYDEKTLKDVNDAKNNTRLKPISMPLFTLQWSMRQYGLDYLAHQCCWDLVNTARAHESKADEIETFRRFLDEDLSTQQLAFFLRMRAICLRRGISLPVESITNHETGEVTVYNRVFLTTATAIELVQKLFQKAGQTVVDSCIRAVRADSVRKPSATVDQSVTYVSMISLLNNAINAFQDYEINELKKLMNLYVIYPRPDSKAFKELIKDLIPASSDQSISELYRLMLSAPKIEHGGVYEKKQIAKSQFIEKFDSRSLLSKKNIPETLEIENIFSATPEFETAKAKWNNLTPILDNALEVAQNKEKNLVLSHDVQCLRLQIENVNSSFICFDIFGAYKNMLACLLNYQELIWTLNTPDPNEMNETTNALMQVLDI